MGWFGPQSGDCSCCGCPDAECSDATFTLTLSDLSYLLTCNCGGGDVEYDLSGAAGTYQVTLPNPEDCSCIANVQWDIPMNDNDFTVEGCYGYITVQIQISVGTLYGPEEFDVVVTLGVFSDSVQYRGKGAAFNAPHIATFSVDVGDTYTDTSVYDFIACGSPGSTGSFGANNICDISMAVT